MVFDKSSAETLADYIILVNVLNSKTTSRSNFTFTSEYTAGLFADSQIYTKAKERILDHWLELFIAADPKKQMEINSDVNYVHAHLHNCKSDLETHCHWSIRAAENRLGGFLSDCFFHRHDDEKKALPVKRNESDCHVDRLPEMLSSGYQVLTSKYPFQNILQLRPHLTIAYRDSHIDAVDTPEQATMLLAHYLEKIKNELEKENVSHDFIIENLIDRAEPLARLADNIASIDNVAELLAISPEKVAPNDPEHPTWSNCSVMLFLLIEDYRRVQGTEELLKILTRYQKYYYSREKLAKSRKKTEKLLHEIETAESRLASLKDGDDEGQVAFMHCRLGNYYYKISEHYPNKSEWLKLSKKSFIDALAITKYGNGSAAWAWPMMFILKLRAQYALRPSYLKNQFFGPLDTLRLRKAQKLLMLGSANVGPNSSRKMITIQKVLEGRCGWAFTPIPNSDGGQTLEELGP